MVINAEAFDKRIPPPCPSDPGYPKPQSRPSQQYHTSRSVILSPTDESRMTAVKSWGKSARREKK